MRAVSILTSLVPVWDNEGRAFPDSAFRGFEARLLELAGGYTRDGTRSGEWLDPATGAIYRDDTRAYTTSVDPVSADTIAESIARDIRERFTQVAAYVTRTEGRVSC